MTAKEIIALLAARHSEDVFVPECKGGPTWTGNHERMDGWAMKKSWSHPLVRAYEVKVTRSDFLRDDKWTGYLKFCNEFYFVCPPKVIQPEELSPDAGLLYVASNGKIIFTKKKAPYRKVSIPEEVYRYILMSRVKIGDEDKAEATISSKLEYWRGWLGSRSEATDIGWRVSKGVAEYVGRVERENAALKQENEALALFKKRLQELGVNASDHIRDWNVTQEIDRLRGRIPYWVSGLPRELRKMADCVEELTANKPKASADDEEAA